MIFDVDPLRAAEIVPGNPITVHSTDYLLASSEAIVDNVVGTTVTLKTPIEFTPIAGMILELIGFIDGLGPYRLL